MLLSYKLTHKVRPTPQSIYATGEGIVRLSDILHADGIWMQHTVQPSANETDRQRDVLITALIYTPIIGWA